MQCIRRGRGFDLGVAVRRSSLLCRCRRAFRPRSYRRRVCRRQLIEGTAQLRIVRARVDPGVSGDDSGSGAGTVSTGGMSVGK